MACGSGSGTAAGVPVATLLALAERVARRAGDLIRSRARRRCDVADTKTSPTDVVTEMDRAVEALLRSEIGEERPEDGLLGEESGFVPGDSGLTWVIDPIDGTVNYLYGLPYHAVNVAVVEGNPPTPGEWAPLAGCVHNPVTGQTWTAGVGAGARLDGARLRMAAPPALSMALVGTGFGYTTDRRRSQAETLRSLLPEVRDIRRFGAASLDLCKVASGQLDAFYERGLNPWDMAAAALVVAEAGGEVSGIDGQPPHEHMLVAAAPGLRVDLVERLEALNAGRG